MEEDEAVDGGGVSPEMISPTQAVVNGKSESQEEEMRFARGCRL